MNLSLSPEQLATTLFALQQLVIWLSDNVESLSSNKIDGPWMADQALSAYSVVLAAAIDANVPPEVIKSATVDEKTWNLVERIR